jgi:hypothetical protein
MAETQSIPPEVAAAIVKVMTGVKTLGKDDTNKFQKYDFVSVDRFLAAVGPLCAGAGLVILQEEDSVDISTKETTDDYGKTKASSWLTVRYAFTFVHASGAAYGPLHRSVIVPANGAQAFGSAQSYALKQFQRAQFQIPTGDADDADRQEAQPLPNQTRKPAQQQQKPQEFRPPSETPFDDQPKKDPDAFWKKPSLDLDPKREKTMEQFADSLERAIAAAPTEKALNKLIQDNDTRLDGLCVEMRDRGNEILEANKRRLGALMAA